MNHNECIEEFRKKFSQFKNENLILYGTGIMAQKVLEQCKDFHIIGVMDLRKEEKSSFCGKPMIFLDELDQLGVFMVIIVAKVSNYEIIFNRIGKHMFERDICVMGMNGWNLSSRYGHLFRQREFFRLSYKTEEQIRNGIEESQVVFFSLFDTLLVHKYLYRSDFYEIVQSKAMEMGMMVAQFSEMRRIAEDSVRKKGGDFQSIYDELQIKLCLSELQKQKLQALELECEKNFVAVRQKMLSLWNDALDKGKKLYIIDSSSMGKEQIVPLLAHFGIDGYQDILILRDADLACGFSANVSSKRFMSGQRGMYICSGLKSSNWEKRNVRTYVIPGIKEMLQYSAWGQMEKAANTVNERMLLGYCAAEVFQDPFALSDTEGKIPIETEWQIGAVCLFPVAVKYMVWLMNHLHGEKVEKVLFSARDGYLFQRLYEMARELVGEEECPKGEYFLTSRKACMKAGIRNKGDLEKVYRYNLQSEKDIRQVLINRFGCTKLGKIKRSMDKKAGWKYLEEHKEEIYENSIRCKINYQVYLEKMGITEGKQELYALYDGFCHGTVMRMLQSLFSLQIKGYFLGLLLDQGNSDKGIEALYRDEDIYQCDNNMQRYSFFFEAVCSSSFPSLSEFDEEGNPQYDEERRSKEHLHFIKNIQVGVEEMFYFYMKNAFIKGIDISADFATLFLPNQAVMKFSQNAECLYHLQLADDMGTEMFHVML